MTRAVEITALALCAAVLAGCWSRPSPQQSFAEALMRGNSMQASQIWLHMSPEDRLKFAHGEGIKPDTSQQDVRQTIIDQYQKKLGKGPSTAEEAEKQVPTSLGASLENLSNGAQQSGATAAPSQPESR